MNEVISSAKNLYQEHFPCLVQEIDRLTLIDSKVESPYETICISHRPNIAPQAYAFRLYKGVSQEQVNKYEEVLGIKIPSLCRNYLQILNGAFIYELSLFGLPPSMISDTPMLNRVVLSPHDLETANRAWIHEYKNIDNKLFHIGGGPYSFSENIGYFLNHNGEIFSIRKSGEILTKWDSFLEFLEAEIARASKQYPKHEKFMSDLRSKHRDKKPWWNFWA